MGPSRTTKSGAANTVVALALVTFAVHVSVARGFPSAGQQRYQPPDSAVEGVQKYLESSGFPKMTRGEVLEFLADLSRDTQRVNRSGRTGGGQAAAAAATDRTNGGTRSGRTVGGQAAAADGTNGVTTAAGTPPTDPTRPPPGIPDGESPLSYGYPMSAAGRRHRPEATTQAAVLYVTMVPGRDAPSRAGGNENVTVAAAATAMIAATVPSADPKAYARFKKIPTAKNMKFDDGMEQFLDRFGLLDEPRPAVSREPRRRADYDAGTAEPSASPSPSAPSPSTPSPSAPSSAVPSPAALSSVAASIAESISKSDHVFNPTGSDVRTLDVNRIAKIVENIRLLTENDNAASLPADVIQKKFENITAAIDAIDSPEGDGKAGGGGDATAFNGYEVFFDDNSKELDSDLPESSSGAADGGGGVADGPALSQAHSPPDPLSVDELQQLLEKNEKKSDVKRQEPAPSSQPDDAAEPTTAAVPSEPTTTDMLLEATSLEAATSARDSSSSSTAAAAAAATDATTAAATEPNPSLSQLAESFGGGETAVDPPAAGDLSTTAAPGRPKNGLYFYVDWNSFLTVNSGQRNQVNLRFAPKAGNPAHFLRVTVP